MPLKIVSGGLCALGWGFFSGLAEVAHWKIMDIFPMGKVNTFASRSEIIKVPKKDKQECHFTAITQVKYSRIERMENSVSGSSIQFKPAKPESK